MARRTGSDARTRRAQPTGTSRRRVRLAVQPARVSRARRGRRTRRSGGRGFESVVPFGSLAFVEVGLRGQGGRISSRRAWRAGPFVLTR